MENNTQEGSLDRIEAFVVFHSLSLRLLTVFFGFVYMALFILLLLSHHEFAAHAVKIFDHSMTSINLGCWVLLVPAGLLSFSKNTRPIGAVFFATIGRLSLFLALLSSAIISFVTLGPLGLIVGTLSAFFGVIIAAIIGMIHTNQLPYLVAFLLHFAAAVFFGVLGKVMLNACLSEQARLILDKD